MKLEIERPAHLVDISRLPLDRDRGDGGRRAAGRRAGAATAISPPIRGCGRAIRCSSQALLAGASGQIRNKASTGGNLLQRTRCPYFYDRNMPCNKREPGSGCAALQGFNRMHAVLGASEACIAVHPSDMAVAMAGARRQGRDHIARRRDAARSRSAISIDCPATTPHVETALGHGEMITAVTLPPPPPGRQVYRKVRDRASYAFALVSVAAIVEKSGDRIRSARIALGGVAAKPWRATEAERMLAGAAVSDGAFTDAAEAALAGAVGHGGNDFKIRWRNGRCGTRSLLPPRVREVT